MVLLIVETSLRCTAMAARASFGLPRATRPLASVAPRLQPLRSSVADWAMYVHRGKALESAALLIVETACVLIVETARPERALQLLAGRARAVHRLYSWRQRELGS